MKSGRVRGALVSTAAVALAVAVTTSMGGCVYSDTITQRVIDTNEQDQVDPNLDPMLINDQNAKKKTTQLPKLVNDPSSSSSSDNVKKTPVYTSDKSKVTTTESAPRPKYRQTAKNAGEASVKSSTQSKSKTEQKNGKTTKKKSKVGSKKKASTKGTKSNKGKSSKKGKGGSGSGKGSGTGTGNGKGNVYTTNSTKNPKIPSGIKNVAAVGNTAVIVSMVAGTSSSTPLKACDSSTQSQTKKILSAKGISKAKALWSGDGTNSGSLSSANFNKLIAKDTIPDLVFVTTGTKTLSSSQIKTLKKHKVDVYYLPPLTSSKYIRFSVEVVGKILDKGGNSIAGDNYKSYLSYEKNLTNKYSGEVGGVTGGYNFDTEENVDGPSTTIATLYIDDWDSNARYSGSSAVSSSNGVALATLGYQSAPISYYLSMGGAVNNAAAYYFRSIQDADGQLGIVWQFAKTHLDFKLSNWNNLSATKYDLASEASHSTAVIFREDLLCYTESSGRNYYGYGTDTFPAVIAKNKKIASSFTSASKRSGQLYYAYPEIQTNNGTVPGIELSSNSYAESCIGVNNGKQDSGSTDVLVNPKGLAQKNSSDDLCNWATGSPESVLETSWAYWQFRGGSKSDFESDVTTFYKDYYGYDVTSSDLKKIENGCSK